MNSQSAVFQPRKFTASIRIRWYCERLIAPSWFFQSATGSSFGVLVHPTSSFCPSGPVKRAPAASVDRYFHPCGSPMENPWLLWYVSVAMSLESPEPSPLSDPLDVPEPALGEPLAAPADPPASCVV